MKSRDERDEVVRKITELIGEANEMVVEPTLAEQIDLGVRVSLTKLGLVCRFENLLQVQKIVRRKL